MAAVLRGKGLASCYSDRWLLFTVVFCFYTSPVAEERNCIWRLFPRPGRGGVWKPQVLLWHSYVAILFSLLTSLSSWWEESKIHCVILVREESGVGPSCRSNLSKKNLPHEPTQWEIIIRTRLFWLGVFLCVYVFPELIQKVANLGEKSDIQNSSSRILPTLFSLPVPK